MNNAKVDIFYLNNYIILYIFKFTNIKLLKLISFEVSKYCYNKISDKIIIYINK